METSGEFLDFVLRSLLGVIETTPDGDILSADLWSSTEKIVMTKSYEDSFKLTPQGHVRTELWALPTSNNCPLKGHFWWMIKLALWKISEIQKRFP